MGDEMTNTQDMPTLLRWAICLVAVALHWFLFVGIAEWYITAFVTPRTGLYFTHPMEPILYVGPPASFVLIWTAFAIVDWRGGLGRILLALWLLVGIFISIWSARDEIAAGREFLPDVVCYAWLFIFHALAVFAMLATRPQSEYLRSI